VRTVLIFSAILLFSACEGGEKITGAEIVEFGVFEKNSGEKRVDTKESLVGTTPAVVDVRLRKQTTSIVAELGNSFGIRFKLLGRSPYKVVTCSFRWLRPKLTNPHTGKSSETDMWEGQLGVGETRYVGYTFDNDWEIVPGKWTIQAIHDSKVLAEKTFDVVVAQ
jgi:hypothetical protein